MPIETERGLKVTVSFGQRRVLLMLAERGRKVELNVSQLNKEVREGISGLVGMLLMRATPLIGTDREVWELTDLGSQVVDQMRQTNKVEVESAKADKNFQAMMGNGRVDCPTCGTPQDVIGGKVDGHVHTTITEVAGQKALQIGRCPGSGRSV